MRIITTSSPTPSDTLGRLAFYSGLDNLTLFEIHSGLLDLMDPPRLATYSYEMELQAALLDLSFAGIHIDEGARRKMVAEFSATSTNLTTLLNDMLEAIGYFDYYAILAVHEFSQHVTWSPSSLPSSWDEWLSLPLSDRRALKSQAGAGPLARFQKALKEFSSPFNPNSPAQKLRLFYHFFGSPSNTIAQQYPLPPPWSKTTGIKEYKSRKTSGEYGPSADREALDKIIKASDRSKAYTLAAPFAHVCLEIADLNKSLGFLNCKLEHGMFRASFGAVTETGRLASRQNAQGYGSNAQNVSPKLRHIFTVPQGQKIIAIDYSQIESRVVAAICYRLFGAVRYLAAVESGDAHSLTCSMVWSNLPWPEDFTLDWTIAHGPFPKDMLKAAKQIASKEFYRGKSMRDASKTLGHGCLTADHEVLTPNGWVPISDKPPIIFQRDGTFAEVSNWIDKEYSGTFIEWKGTAISVNMTTDHRVYYTTDQRCYKSKRADLVPKSAMIELGETYKGGDVTEPLAALYAAYHCDGSWTGYGQVHFNFHKERKIMRLTALADKLNIPWKQYNSGEIALEWKPEFHGPGWFMLEWDRDSLATYMNELVHWDGHIGKTTQTLFSTKRDWIECWQTLNRVLGKGGNIQKPHLSGFGSVVYQLQINNRKYAGRPDFKVDRKYEATAQVYCPTVPAAGFYVRRDGKISVTGNSNYLGKPPTMSRHSHIPVPLVEHFQAAYFEAFPEIPQWHSWVIEQVQTKAIITTLLGRTRQFFGRPNDDATIREAVAYEPQSVAADYCNRALLALHKRSMAGTFPAQLFLSKHDEIGVRFDQTLESEVLSIMTEVMEQKIQLTAPDGSTRWWYVPVEAESGWNLGRASPTNPNGLSHPDPARTCAPTPGWRDWIL